MRRSFLIALILVALTLSAISCAQTKKNRAWEPGDTLICPHCGRDFTVPEKLGK